MPHIHSGITTTTAEYIKNHEYFRLEDIKKEILMSNGSTKIKSIDDHFKNLKKSNEIVYDRKKRLYKSNGT
ncbi:hypothetical protein ACFL1H_02325 [Nanoarchaeota archaeon]